MRPLKRALFTIDNRSRNKIQREGFYQWPSEKIVLAWPWWKRKEHLETQVETIIEHETIHHVLSNRVDIETSHKFHNIIEEGTLQWVFTELIP